MLKYMSFNNLSHFTANSPKSQDLLFIPFYFYPLLSALQLGYIWRIWP